MNMACLLLLSLVLPPTVARWLKDNPLRGDCLAKLRRDTQRACVSHTYTGHLEHARHGAA